MILGLTLAAQEPNSVQRVIDLKAIGYPQPPCDYMFQVDSYRKNHLEFLNSERLLVSFPADTSNCDKKDGYSGRNASKYRSVVMDLSGRILHAFDWNLGDDVQAGPDGHILMVTGTEIRVLETDFSVLQTIPDIPRGPVRSSLQLSPSRHGFAKKFGYPEYRVIYFEGSPLEKTQDADDCRLVTIVDGGFFCRNPEQLQEAIPHVTLKAATVPTLDQRADECWSGKILRKRWLLPPWPTWLSREANDVSTSGRVMCFTTGTLFPISDTSGFGYFLRVAILDVVEKQVVFRKQYNIDSDVALSPDGHWFAVREQTRLTLHRLR
jgi:hypothetical protein